VAPELVGLGQVPPGTYGAIRAMRDGEPVFMAIVPEGSSANVQFLEPRRHSLTLENLSEVCGPFVALVDLNRLLANLP
jgi:hypothetical protein